MEKELQALEERTDANIHLESLRAFFFLSTELEMPGYDVIHGFWF